MRKESLERPTLPSCILQEVLQVEANLQQTSAEGKSRDICKFCVCTRREIWPVRRWSQPPQHLVCVPRPGEAIATRLCKEKMG